MRRWIIPVLAFVLVSLPLALSAQDSQETTPPWRRELPAGRQQATITVGNSDIQVDLAIDPLEQQIGLGYRNGLDEDTGMLFTSSAPSPRTFWMKGMRFCIDIIWIHDGEITGAAESVCPDPEGTDDADRARFSSGIPITFVLEMPAGWLQENGYGPGTPVDLGDLDTTPRN
jgi:uncharacterized protein